MMLKRAGMLILALFFITAFSLSASGKILFKDDFEADNIGGEPALWNMVGGFTLKVAKDPQDAGNKVLLETGEADGLGVPTPANWEKQNWTDYIWEFDWMWEVDVYAGTAHRYQDPQHYYHSSRRVGGLNFIIYNWNGNWNELDNKPWSSQTKIWYRMQISDIGDKHTVKGKKRDDVTPFDKLNPIVSAVNGTYADGPIGLFGADGSLYWDNIIVYEPGTNLTVEPAKKLTIAWGKIKAKF